MLLIWKKNLNPRYLILWDRGSILFLILTIFTCTINMNAYDFTSMYFLAALRVCLGLFFAAREADEVSQATFLLLHRIGEVGLNFTIFS